MNCSGNVLDTRLAHCVLVPTSVAGSQWFFSLQRLSACTNPTTMTRGIPVHQFMWTNIASYNGTSSNQAALAQPNSANYGCVGTDTHSFFDPCFDGNPLRITTSWQQVVC